jgi:hypothetical protein
MSCTLFIKEIIDGEIIDDSLEELEIKEVLKVRELVRMNKRWEPRLGARTLLVTRGRRSSNGSERMAS